MPTEKKKIPLPWATIVDEKKQMQALSYWRISQSWNGRSAKSVTVMDAIASLNDILDEIDPQRKLAAVVSCLKCNVVEFGTKSRMKKHEKALNINQTWVKDPKIVLL